MNEFREWLELEMGKREWSISDLARSAGVARGSIGNILRGERGPGPDLCEAIAKAFRIPPETVFRKAGLLPDKQEDDETSQEILHIAHLLDRENKDDLLAYARLRLQLQEEKGDALRAPTHPSRSTA